MKALTDSLGNMNNNDPSFFQQNNVLSAYVMIVIEPTDTVMSTYGDILSKREEEKTNALSIRNDLSLSAKIAATQAESE